MKTRVLCTKKYPGFENYLKTQVFEYGETRDGHTNSHLLNA